MANLINLDSIEIFRAAMSSSRFADEELDKSADYWINDKFPHYSGYALYDGIHTSGIHWGGEFSLDVDKKIFIYAPCKSGQSSFKSLLNHLKIGNSVRQRTKQTRIEVLEHLLATDFTHYIILRDPVERALSACYMFSEREQFLAHTPFGGSASYDQTLFYKTMDPHFISQLAFLPYHVSREDVKTVIKLFFLTTFKDQTEINQRLDVGEIQLDKYAKFWRENIMLLNHIIFNKDKIRPNTKYLLLKKGNLDPNYIDPFEWISGHLYNVDVKEEIYHKNEQVSDQYGQWLEYAHTHDLNFSVGANIPSYEGKQLTLVNFLKDFFAPDIEFMDSIDFENVSCKI